MKLEPGKYYKTRDGEKALVKFVDQDVPPEANNDTQTCFGYVWWDDGSFSEWVWKDDGMYEGGERSGQDLVSEWNEPEEVEITIYRTPGGKILVYQGEPMEGQEDMFKIVKKLKVTLNFFTPGQPIMFIKTSRKKFVNMYNVSNFFVEGTDIVFETEMEMFTHTCNYAYLVERTLGMIITAIEDGHGFLDLTAIN